MSSATKLAASMDIQADSMVSDSMVTDSMVTGMYLTNFLMREA